MENNKILRILHITVGMDRGGIENFLMNLYRSINREIIQFDFLIHMKEKQAFEEEIKKLGGKIYRTPSLGEVGPLKYAKELNKFFKKNKYSIIHSHYNAVNGVILNEARKCGIKNRISHSHTSYPEYKLLEKIYKEYYSKNLLRFVATERFACSSKAGKWLYGNNFKVFNNGISTEEYKYNLDIREKVRSNLGLKQNEILIGHIGRFVVEKNHKFLIKVFKELYKKNNNYRLILIGDGILKNEVEFQVKKDKEIYDKIKFLGIRSDVKELLQGMDLVIFPSLYEGLPVALVEAQGSGLKCFISSSIASEIDLGCNLIKTIDLHESVQEWANIIENERIYDRIDTSVFLKNSGYDVKKNAKDLEKFYLNLKGNENKWS